MEGLSNIDFDQLSQPSTSYSRESYISDSPEHSSEQDCSKSATGPDQSKELEEQEVNEAELVDDYDSLGGFYFESDHIALKGNSDYRNLMEVFIKLQAQKIQAVKDMDKLYECQEMALADPIGFVEKLQRGEDLGIPKPQKVMQLPIIDWSKYAISGSQTAFGRRQLTRLSTKSNSDFSGLRQAEKGKTIKSDQPKAAKFNQSWTAEEQKRLEELLVLYPPEEVETRRWEKIANALENRTVTQVASRVQKYFIKLMKAGISVPGRMPNAVYLRKPRRHIVRQHPSTFLVSQTPTVLMNDADDENKSSYGFSQLSSERENSFDGRMDVSDDDEVSPELRNTPEYQELIVLKKVLKTKQNLIGLAQHVGYKCTRCECEPIIGVRWHCTECASSNSVDFCEDCVDCMHETESHSAHHHLDAVHHASSTFADRDYMHFLGNDYNYLDPNYMPAI